MKRVAPVVLCGLFFAASTARAEDEVKVEHGTGAPLPAAEPVDDEAPARRYPPPSTRFKLIGTGIGITGAAWGFAFGAASGWPEVPGSSELKIPVVGPWLALGKSGCATGDSDCGAKIAMRGILYVIDALVQIGGLGLVVERLGKLSGRAARGRPRARWRRA